MPRYKKPKTKKRIPAHLRIPPEFGLLTATAKQLYDLIYWYGLGGCWMSNKTIAARLGCSGRSVQRARQLLVKRQVIITARTNPRTWMMWSRYHPAVKNCPVLLYPIKQEMPNLYYEIPPDRVGVTISRLRGDKLSPKLDVVVPTRTTTVEPAATTAAGLSSVRSADTTPPVILISGVAPLKPAAVQGRTWSKFDCQTIIAQRERVSWLTKKAFLLNDDSTVKSFTWHEAGDRILAEEKLKFTDREKFWIDELMDLNVFYDDAFDLVLEERDPGSIPWLNQKKK